MDDANYDAKTIETLLQPCAVLYSSGDNRSISWRLTQLRSMRQMIINHKNEFLEALNLDLGKTRYEGEMSEISVTLLEIDYIISNLSSWMKPVKVKSPGFMIPNFAEYRYEPLRGPACLIIGPFNYPFQLTLIPAAGSLSAGNPTVIKPSELCRATSTLLATLIPKYFQPGVLQVIEGGVNTTSLLLEREWGLIFFTGSSRVGKIVGAAAGKTLTPTVLELGGKSPVYVDKNYPDMVSMVNRIAWGKTCNSGQTCVAPDYLLCHESVASKFQQELVKAFQRMYSSCEDKSDMTRIVTPAHAERLVKMIKEVEEAGCKIILGGSTLCNPSGRFITPTIVLNPSMTSALMTEEVFGPVLPLITVRSEQEAIQIINSMPGTPLALYVFTAASAVFERFIQQCSSAAAARNDVITQFATSFLPTGGLGSSGNGYYHGKFSFEAFSHKRAVNFKPCHYLFEYGGLRYGPNSSTKAWLMIQSLKLPPIPVMKPFLLTAVVLGALSFVAFKYLPLLVHCELKSVN